VRVFFFFVNIWTGIHASGFIHSVTAKRYENDLSDYEKAVSGGEPAREPVYKDLRASDLHSLSELEEQRRKRREEYV
jgi:hypothetical protein